MSTVQQSQNSQQINNTNPNRGYYRRGRGGRGRGNPQRGRQSTTPASENSQTTSNENVPVTENTHKSARSRKFGGQLSTSEPAASSATTASSNKKREPRPSEPKDVQTTYSHSGDVSIPDLTAKLIETLKTPPYADCVICWSSIHPQQPTWSCQLSEETNRCCWGVFHNKCIVAWSKKNLEESRAAHLARNEDKEADWRCPGCQTQRVNPPGPYKCFCGAVVDPKPGRLAMPHSCGMSCQRRRAACEHPCPLTCHPGPCPPCSTLIVKPCYCGSTTVSLRCSRMTVGGEMPLSCGNQCNKLLKCGNHRCEQVCHSGECLPCGEVFQSQCYCGRNNFVLKCGEGKLEECTDGVQTWEGNFSCDEKCKREYNCGKHSCTDPCHPHPLEDRECPRSPNKIITCSCGKKTLSDMGISRTSCTDPLPCCDLSCGKPLENCDHLCSSPCHVGPCPPCQVQISIPCRCGDTVQQIRCSRKGSQMDEILCKKVCRALRNCGKHVCNRPCCPLSHLTTIKGKGRQSRIDPLAENLSLHECDLPCGKLLNCGLHRCERKDHKGLCPPCLQSTFEEMTCVCGRTTLIPPIPCGTQIQCKRPCNRPDPPCGHPSIDHSCHETEGCPPCPFLTAKQCACGKMTLPNVRCSQPKVSCGTACGKPMPCGFHTCQKMCHSGDCGDCENVCGKDRKLCLPDHHPCMKPCHAPSACPEIEPCAAIITLSCPCGRIKRQVPCGRSLDYPTGRNLATQPKCTSECHIAQRNARLAEALGIDTTSHSGNEKTAATYTPELITFGKANLGFVKVAEGAFADFYKSTRTAQVLPHMPELKRDFVYNLAKVYRMDSRMVDAEPQRSVELLRRIDSRIPSPLLSVVLAQSSTSSLGKLQTTTATPPRMSPAKPAAPLPATGGRAWAAVASLSSSTSSVRSSPAPVQRTLPNSPYLAPRPATDLTPQFSDDVPVDWEADD